MPGEQEGIHTMLSDGTRVGRSYVQGELMCSSTGSEFRAFLSLPVQSCEATLYRVPPKGHFQGW